MMETSYIHYSPEVLEKVNISQDHDKADQDSLPEKEEISDVHDSVNVSCTFRTVNKNCTVSTRENSHLNQKIHAAKHKLKKTAIAHIVKTNEVNTGSPSNRVRLDSDK